MKKRILVSSLAALGLVGCASQQPQDYQSSNPRYTEQSHTGKPKSVKDYDSRLFDPALDEVEDQLIGFKIDYAALEKEKDSLSPEEFAKKEGELLKKYPALEKDLHKLDRALHVPKETFYTHLNPEDFTFKKPAKRQKGRSFWEYIGLPVTGLADGLVYAATLGNKDPKLRYSKKANGIGAVLTVFAVARGADELARKENWIHEDERLWDVESWFHKKNAPLRPAPFVPHPATTRGGGPRPPSESNNPSEPAAPPPPPPSNTPPSPPPNNPSPPSNPPSPPNNQGPQGGGPTLPDE